MVAPNMANAEIRVGVLALDRAVTAKVSMDVVDTDNSLESTMTCRLKEFLRMNPSIFIGSMEGKYPKELYGMYNVFSSMGMTSMEKVELASY